MQLLVAVVVAVLGIVNALVISIHERRREIGILRGLGGERRQVRKTILLEALAIALVGVTLGIAAGGILGYYVVVSFGAAINGWVFPYVFPATMACALVPSIVGIAIAAAWYPARLAARIPLVEALGYE